MTFVLYTTTMWANDAQFIRNLKNEVSSTWKYNGSESRYFTVNTISVCMCVCVCMYRFFLFIYSSSYKNLFRLYWSVHQLDCSRSDRVKRPFYSFRVVFGACFNCVNQEKKKKITEKKRNKTSKTSICCVLLCGFDHWWRRSKCRAALICGGLVMSLCNRKKAGLRQDSSIYIAQTCSDRSSFLLKVTFASVICRVHSIIAYSIHLEFSLGDEATERQKERVRQKKTQRRTQTG